MPPPISQSSMIQNSQNKKRKCDNEVLEDMSIPNLNSTDTDSSSLIPNSQGSCINISVTNVVEGKRQRKTRNAK